jgi:hypothetical protein
MSQKCQQETHAPQHLPACFGQETGAHGREVARQRRQPKRDSCKSKTLSRDIWMMSTRTIYFEVISKVGGT